MKRFTRCACGNEVQSRIVDGFMSGIDLGRPAGAKGMDCSTIEDFCDCGNLEIVTITESEWFDNFDFSPVEAQLNCTIDRQNEVNERPEILDPWGNFVGWVPRNEPKSMEEWQDHLDSCFSDE